MANVAPQAVVGNPDPTAPQQHSEVSSEFTPAVAPSNNGLTGSPLSSSNPSAPTGIPTAGAAIPSPTSTATPQATPTIDAAKPTPAISPAPVPAATSTPDVAPSQATVGPTTKPEGSTEVPEPQSTLTKQFTSAEWKSLKEFRASLPDIFADGYTDDPKARDKPITLWGVHIDPHNPVDARVSVVLMKFLRARNLNVSEARDMFVSTLRWRVSFGVEAALKEEFPENIFGPLGHIYGRDKGGRPVVYNVYGGNKDLKAVFGDVPRFIRWRVALQEKSIALLDFTEIDQTVQIHDYEGVSLTSRDANSKNAASEATNIFQSHYPELLHKKFFVNVPTLLNWIFWVFKPLISANTLAKMTVVGTGHHAIGRALAPVIDANQLPKRYGGNAEAF